MMEGASEGLIVNASLYLVQVGCIITRLWSRLSSSYLVFCLFVEQMTEEFALL